MTASWGTARWGTRWASGALLGVRGVEGGASQPWGPVHQGIRRGGRAWCEHRTRAMCAVAFWGVARWG